jgi:hypothetical protein
VTTRATTLAQAAGPTSRTLAWRPLAGVAGLLALVVAVGRATGQSVDALLGVAAAALAGLVVASLRDPAATLLAGVPVSVMQRRVIRLALVGLPVLALWAALTWVARPAADTHGVGPLVALAVSGVAAAVWWPSHSGVLVGGCIPLAWYALDRFVPWSGVADDVAGWWRTEPWAVAGVAVLVLVAGRRR